VVDHQLVNALVGIDSQRSNILLRKKIMKKKENPIAKDLRTPKYRKRVVKDKTKYDRKNNKRQSPIIMSNGIHSYIIDFD
tara:strand:- start:59 stop:298 length:240 start_codon:yes stop_codon:yes gene_type:complete